VDDEKTASLRAIDAALKQQAFVRDWQHPCPLYVGELDKSGLRIPVSIEIADTEFVHAPVVRLRRTEETRHKPIAHIAGPDGVLCYLDTRATVLDRYDPAGTVLRCLVEAERVLGDALRGRSNQDFAAEFLSYWAESAALVDLPVGFEGTATVRWLDLQGDDFLMPLLARSEDLAPCFANAHKAGSGRNGSPITESCHVAAVNGNLTLDPSGDWPPTDIAALKKWLERMGPKASQCLDQAIGSGNGTRRWIAIKAPNGCAIAMIEIPAVFNRPEFLVTRKASLLGNLLKRAPLVGVTRYAGRPIDETYLYSRNLGEMKSLACKSIAVIGCGTIGGFLARQLAQSGAGSCGGKLLLLDKEVLWPGNLGRHLLGVTDLGRNKAEGCRDLITRELPHLNVEAESDDALHKLDALARCDLIIDATGEEAFSIALNHHAVRKRPRLANILYVWLAGNGAVAQSLLCDGPEHACYKCMKPELAGQPRYRAVRSGKTVRHDANAACGDGLFVPFPVSRSVSAAALGLEATLAWANGRPEPHFRNQLLDAAEGFQVKDANPVALPSCPACGGVAE
jgi:molybdopterin/thiamine biosynthesis adenylyltransferase